VLGAALAYVAPSIATHGLALDGLVYANVAMAHAAGEGSFWRLPYYTEGLTAFIDHPPLGIWLESLWFRAFGTDFWVEKSWSIALAAAIVTLTAGIWRDVTGGRSAWWPLLLLFLMPVATYTMRNNFLELPLTLFVLAGVWAAHRARRHAGWLALVALAVAAGLLTKGPVGLVLLAAPVLFGWSDGRIGRGLLHALACTSGAALVVGLATLSPDAREMLAAWWRQQLVASLAGDRPIVHGRVWQVGVLGASLAMPAVVVAIARWRADSNTAAVREVLTWFALAVAAALPLLASPRQFRHYLMPALPLFAIGLALIANPGLPRLPWRWLAPSAFGIACVIIVLRWGEIGEDVDEIAAARTIAALVRTNGVTFCPSADSQFFLKAYLYRYAGMTSHPAVNGDPFVVCAGLPHPGYASVQPVVQGLWAAPGASTPRATHQR
jgi:4-amino-4-deoxy-L-arabinose transferase-like glycosyltransferase